MAGKEHPLGGTTLSLDDMTPAGSGAPPALADDNPRSSDAHGQHPPVDPLMQPRIFFYARFPEPTRDPSLGGPRVVVQHAEILRDHGIPASIVFRPRRPWTRTSDQLFVTERDFRRTVTDRDLVVLPGRFAHNAGDLPGERKVILTQLAAYTLASFPVEHGEPYPWHRSDVKAVLTSSEHNAGLIRLADPQCPVHVLPNRADIGRFTYREMGEKEDLLLLNNLSRPQKNPKHSKAVLNLLRSRSRRSRAGMHGHHVKVLDGIAPSAIPDLLARAKLLVFLSIDEGLPLLPLEAMASGTVVISYDIGPMNEYIPPEYLRPWGDIAGLVEIAESVLGGERDEYWTEVTRRARARAEDYSRGLQERSVLSVYSELLRDG
jgi:glycosyltransferase involved in cell wall biosynthesis